MRNSAADLARDRRIALVAQLNEHLHSIALSAVQAQQRQPDEQQAELLADIARDVTLAMKLNETLANYPARQEPQALSDDQFNLLVVAALKPILGPTLVSYEFPGVIHITRDAQTARWIFGTATETWSGDFYRDTDLEGSGRDGGAITDVPSASRNVDAVVDAITQAIAKGPQR